MISRVCRVSVAVLAALTMASACFAADVTDRTHLGSIGAQIGGSTFRADRLFGSDWFGDYSEGASPRLDFHGHWRYTAKSWLRLQLGIGFTWAGYSDNIPNPQLDPNFPDDTNKGGYLTLMVPIPLTAQYLLHRGTWTYYAGAGPGVYRVWVQNQRKVLKDDQTKKLHRGLYLGWTGELGVEHALKEHPTVSLEFAIAGHVASSTRDDQFPLGFNSGSSAVEFRIGANYYFIPGERRKPAETTAAPKTP